MLILDHETDPSLNLAAEQYLLREVGEPVVRVWRNSPCVVIGRHQVPCIEVDVCEAARRGVPVLRRISGGGAVYHDLGNINFTIITPSEGGKGVDYDRLLCPVMEALRGLGLDVVHAGRGVLRLGGAKITGSSAVAWRGRVLVHGTILYNADLGALHRLLMRDKAAYGANTCVRSVPDTVANVSSFKDFGGVDAFVANFSHWLASRMGGEDAWRGFTQAERARIGAIAVETTLRPEWNLGMSPDYAIGAGESAVRVSGGRIASDALNGVWHEPVAVLAALATAGRNDDWGSVGTFFGAA
jgi:lipoate-protein ligase A